MPRSPRILIIQDDLEHMTVLLTANGGITVASQLTSVAQSGHVDDADAEFTQIEKEFDKAYTVAVIGRTE